MRSRLNKLKCKTCHKTIRADITPVTCDACSSPFHRGSKCSGLSRAESAILPLQWHCEPCARLRQDFTTITGGTAAETAAGGSSGRKSNRSLKILQWNADGLTTKSGELELRLRADGFDIALIQETKLRPGTRTPLMPGYSAIRLGRDSQGSGGGIISYIKNTLAFERVQESNRAGTEASIFRVKMGKKKWAVIANIYCPPTRSHTHQSALHLDRLPCSPELLILGDFNAHNPLWDYFQPEDPRGKPFWTGPCKKT